MTYSKTIDHVLLGIHGQRERVDETFGEHFPVELLEVVLVIQVLEYGDTAGQLVVDIVVV